MEFLFRFRVSFDDFLPYYQGAATMVEVKDIHGKILWINGRHFRPFVTRDGVKGLFKMTLDKDGKLVSLVKIE
ncbi:DUF2835 family protein [Shewanella sp. JM162201]|uniref:DUF2835 family protein n=1 Tax=Shewanella jiangmenensis TaxID=2837387 RepID=A0ABS5V7N0_9GAMM|nr:DUF2835 domain-containing protein [Shewanella jiangmenensis]MBT1445666.1 DUF2835 family protein [Shewanella jiangmenensis]